MFKSKIFNSVMRYMLVAMLALLPNAIWGLTEHTAISIASGSSTTFTGLNNYFTTNDYTAWFVLDASGNNVDITRWSISNPYRDDYKNKSTYWVFPKPWWLGDTSFFTITTAGEDISNYKIVLLVSSSEAFFNAPSEATAEKKITFKLVSQNDIPLLKDYTGTNKMSVTDFVADGSTSYDISGLASSIESSLALPSSSDGNSFDLSSKKLYLRLNLVNKTTNKVVEAANYTVKRDGKEINTPTMTDWPNVDCKTNKGTFFYLTNNTSNITKDNIKYTFSVPDGQKISDYKIDVYLSDEAADVSNNTLLQEPTLKAKITYNLMPQSEKDKLTFDATDDSSLDASKVFNFRQVFTSTTAKVQLLTEENKQRLCDALGVSALSNVTDLYVRWMITDKSGNAIPGITASGLTLRKDKTTGKEIYYTWFSENAASTLSAALNPTFIFPSWDDLKVSCVVSNTKLVEGTNVKYGVMIKEPDAFNIKFDVSLEEAPLLNDLDAAFSANLKTKLLYLKETTIKNKQLVITDIASQIKDFSLYTKDASGNYEASAVKPIYYRVSIIDKKTNKPMSSISYYEVSEAGGISGGLNSSSFQGKDKYNNSKGLFYYSKDKTSVPESDFYIAFGFNNETDFKNSRIEVYFSDEAPVLENYLVVTEPTIKGKLVYDIKSATDAPFKHYKGYANADNDYEVIDASKNQLRQKVSTWEYTYVVDDADHKTVSLMLPIQNFESSGDALEPLGYYRWYNYDTDNASANLSVEGTSSLLNSVKDADNVDKGLMAFNLMEHATQKTVGVKYTRPNDPNWKGETIACDVSRYIDGIDATGTYMEHEPTLSIRYIFHIIPSTQMAEILKEDLVNDSKDLTFEDNKNVTVGFMNDNSKMTLRLDFVDPKMYYFYPVTKTKHVYYPAGSTEAETNQRKITYKDFSSDIKKAATIEWRAYNGTRDKMCILGPGNVSDFPRFFDLSINLLNGATWTNLDGGIVTKPTFNPGDYFYVVAYVKDETEEFSSPMANFSIRYFRFYPKTFEEMGAADVTRQISYLDENYNNIAVVSFDNDSPEQTLSAPTSPDDNQSKNPSAWNRRSYGFVYKDLIDKSANRNNTDKYYNTKHSPQHGEYGIYKTANIKDISGNGDTGTDGYMWYSWKELHDRTYEATGKSQSGSFLYIDASDESRTIASAEFTASLCTGQQMAFSACIADMTQQTVKPQIMFRLFGLEKDEYGNIKDKKLLHSFSSGDFGTNLLRSEEAKWYQVYGKITIQQEAQVEKYSDFRIEIDNYSKGTVGADYAVDDIRIYLKPAKVEIYQDRPACGETSTGSIKLKIRAIHETLNAITGHKGQTKIYFRFVDENGKPVEGTDESNPYYQTIQNHTSDASKNITYKSNKYGAVDVFDSEGTCNQYTIDGTPMIEKDSEGETYIVISNRYYPLEVGKKYYVSVATETPDATGNSNWGSPAEVCSLYSNWFEMVSQHPVITDTDGKIVTDYKIPCNEAGSYSVKIKGQLVTTDPNTGGKITLDGVNFIWYLDGTGDDNKVDPSAAASNEITISGDKLPLGEEHKIYMLPEGTPNADGYIPYVINGKTYLLCPSAIPVPLRVMKDGPQLNFGFNDVDYPFNDGSYEASLRIGLPQLEKLKASEGYLKVPLHSATMRDGTAINEPLTFIDDSSTPAVTSNKVIVASTNDPLWETKLNTQVATLEKEELPAFNKKTQTTLNLKFEDNAVANFHEGYYYVLRFAFEKRAASAGTTYCPGESYLKVKIVPEFITWTPTANGGMNANWNNDDNWHRSSSTELHDKDYTDYQTYGSSTISAAASAPKIDIPTQNSYVPMKFTKVTIDNLKGLPFPDLGNVVYSSTNQIATKLTNGKGNEATKYIQYDIMAFWNEADANKGLEAGNLKCEKFYGNTCHQIYFKPQGELRDQCYLIYDKAWVEKELEPNKWYTMASPLQYIYAGDMYVPAKDGRQETKAFTDITFDPNIYSRSKYPVYQRAWMKSGVEEITPKSDYPASHYPDSAKTDDMNLNLGYWSHVYNKVDESYAADGTFGGFAIKAGNALLPKRPTDGNTLPNAILRLPKEDTSYQYYDYNGTTTSDSTDVTKPDVSAIVSSDKNSTGHGKLLVAFNNDEKHLAEKTQSLGTDNNSGFYLVANPYTCSISMAKFFEANTGLQKAIWMVEKGEVKAISNAELDKQNYAIQPTQSFFVKKNEGATIREVRFTSAMYVDRTITPGLLMASDYVKSIEATTENSNGQISKARIALRPEASADYDDQEDVDLLYDQNLKDVPQVYTVAGNEAVAVNAVPELSWIPLGIVSQQAEEVSLTLKGVNKLDAPVYLYDAASASFTELHEGEAVKVKAGDHGRYFLTQTRTSTGIDRMEAEEQSAPVKVYSPAAGMIVVSALGGEKLDRVQVFTLDGKMVHSYQLPDKQRMILRVPSGIYIVKASTQSCAQTKGQKISVR